MGKDEKKDVLVWLEEDLEKYDRIILVDQHKVDRRMVDAFFESESLRDTDKKTLVLSETCGRECNHVTWRCIEEREIQEIENLYYMYEFSDRFLYFPGEPNCGGLLNYVETGILTVDEAFSAFMK